MRELTVLKATDPRAKGLPTVTTRFGDVVDTLAMKESGKKWDAIVAETGLPMWDAVVLTYHIELVRDPSLAFDGTADDAGARIAALREKNYRWLRIAVYGGLRGEGTARTIYEKHTQVDSATTYTGRGRYFAEARQGVAKVDDPANSTYAATVKTVRKAEGVRGDANQAARAIEVIEETAKPKRTARKAK